MVNSNQSLLGLTIGNKYIETVSDLLNRGADPNVEFNFFCTLRPIFPIFKAVEIGSTELVKIRWTIELVLIWKTSGAEVFPLSCY